MKAEKEKAPFVIKKNILMYASIIVGIVIVLLVAHAVYHHYVISSLASNLSSESDKLNADIGTFDNDFNAAISRFNSAKDEMLSAMILVIYLLVKVI